MKTNYLIMKGIREPKIIFKSPTIVGAEAWIDLYKTSNKSRGVSEVYIYKIHKTRKIR